MLSDTQETSDTRETTMSEPILNSDSLHAMLQDIQSQLAHLVQRVAGLEELAALSGSEAVPAASEPEVQPVAAEPVAASAAEAAPSAVVESDISEEEVLAISAAIAAWLGVQAHIRQIRLIRTGAWAQQGRVTIQSSHTLNH